MTAWEATVRDGHPDGRDANRGGRSIGWFEFLPGWLLHGPLVLYWILLGLRYRDFALPTLANPGITAGGLCGESKGDILDQLDDEARSWVGRYGRLEAGPRALADAEDVMHRLDLVFPVVLKPDVGCKGAGVGLVRDRDALAARLAEFAPGTVLMLQQLLDLPGEASVFYSRRPGTGTGRILSLTLKSSPAIVGDGRRTIEQLVMAHPRAGRASRVYLPRLRHRLDEVLPSGTRLDLVFTGNHSKGSLFREATGIVGPALEARVDAILRTIPLFHHGRVDLRFESVAALRSGRGFRIIEINGVGSEPIHMWDPDASLLGVFREQMRFYGRAFAIGAEMRRRGFRSRGILDVLRLWRWQTRLIATYPPSD